MIKNLVRQSKSLVLIGATVATTWLTTLTAIALPTEQVSKQLSNVPVFVVLNQEGVPLFLQSPTSDEKRVGVFISAADAQQSINSLQQENPELADQAKIVPVPLGEIYKQTLENAEKENPVGFAYVPTKTQVESAQTVLSQSGEEYQGGVPLFIPKVGENQDYIVFSIKDEQDQQQQVVPFFFDKQQAEGWAERFKQENPDQADSVVLEVVALETVMQTLASSDDEMLNKIYLVPTQESSEYIRSLQNQSGDGQE